MQFARCFESMSKLTGSRSNNFGNMIGRKDFADGFTLFVFNLSEDWSDDTFGLIREGIVQLDMGFAVPIPELLTAIVYREYEDCITINKHGIPRMNDDV